MSKKTAIRLIILLMILFISITVINASFTNKINFDKPKDNKIVNNNAVTSIFENVLDKIMFKKIVPEPTETSISKVPKSVISGLDDGEYAKVYVTKDASQKYMKDYMTIYKEKINNATYVNLSRSESGANLSVTLKSGGPYMDEIAGFEMDGLKYAIHLLVCDWETNACAFRINGIPTKRIYNASVANQSNRFVINPDAEIVVNSINFMECGSNFFCDVAYEAYDEVNISFIRR